MEHKEIKSVLECLLFVSDKPLPLSAFQELLEPIDRRTLIECLDELKAEYDAQERSFHLAEIAEGYQLVTRVAYAPWIRKLYKNRVNSRLSRAALETLAIIAYRQPLSKAEIEDIRGVSADGVLNSLLERKLIRIVGRKEAVGRPLLYGTTKEFLRYFGLKDLTDMPELKDLQDMLVQDEAGKDWELNSGGDLVAKVKLQDEQGAETLPSASTLNHSEVTMEPAAASTTQNSPMPPETAAVLPSETDVADLSAGQSENPAPPVDEADDSFQAASKNKRGKDDEVATDEDDDDDLEDEEDDDDLEDEDDDDDLEDEEDDDDLEDEDDDDDLEDEDDDDDLEDEEDDDDLEDEEDDDDEDDEDDEDDLGEESAESEELSEFVEEEDLDEEDEDEDDDDEEDEPGDEDLYQKKSSFYH